MTGQSIGDEQGLMGPGSERTSEEPASRGEGRAAPEPALVEPTGDPGGPPVTPEDVARLRAFLELTEEDLTVLRELHEPLMERHPDLVDAFYEHLLAFPETRRHLEAPGALRRLRHAQADYFEELTSGRVDARYVEARRRVGRAHQRVGLPAAVYVGGFRRYLGLLLTAIDDALGGAPGRAARARQAALKVAFLDMGLALETYVHAERAEADRAREEAESLVRAVPSGLAVLDEEARIVLVNEAFQRMFQVTQVDVLGRFVHEVLPVEGLGERVREVQRAGGCARGLRFESRSPEGVLLAVRVHLASLSAARAGEGAGRLVLLVEDVTEEERLRERMTAMEERFRTVFSSATDGVALVDLDGRIQDLNAAAEHLFGRAREEALGRAIARLVPGLDGARLQAAARAARAPGQGRPEHLALVADIHHGEGLRGDGRRFPLEYTLSAFAVGGKDLVTVVVRDVTQRRAQEEALRRSERRFRALIEGSPDAITVHSGGTIRYANPTMARLLGYDSAEDLVGRPALSLLHPRDRPEAARRVRALERLGGTPPRGEERLLRRDGSIVWVEVVSLLAEFEGQPSVIAVGRDITERKELIARSMEMDRMIATGMVAAGVGHEINNPLTYVRASIDFAQEDVEVVRAFVNDVERELRRLVGDGTAGDVLDAANADGVREVLADESDNLRRAAEGADRIRDVVRDLRTFSRPDDEGRGAVALPEVLDASLAMASHEIRHRARVVKDYQPAPAVWGQAGKLGQVFLNLLVNAAHAIPSGAAEGHEIRVRTYARPGEVVVEVRDTGCGVPPDKLGSIFLPFFTTKPKEQGTGLGLSISKGIVEAHGGRMEVESTPGRGSTFRVVLPPAARAAAHAGAHAGQGEPTRQPADRPARPSRRGRVLVVDDEPFIGSTLRRTLGDVYEVVTTASAREALTTLRADARFDAILCDLMMPNMTGMDLHAELARTAPALAARMVFMTGGVFTPDARTFLERVPNAQVDKPFDMDKLRQVLARVTAEATAPGGHAR